MELCTQLRNSSWSNTGSDTGHVFDSYRIYGGKNGVTDNFLWTVEEHDVVPPRVLYIIYLYWEAEYKGICGRNVKLANVNFNTASKKSTVEYATKQTGVAGVNQPFKVGWSYWYSDGDVGPLVRRKLEAQSCIGAIKAAYYSLLQ
jgi:hypothetical protein